MAGRGTECSMWWKTTVRTRAKTSYPHHDAIWTVKYRSPNTTARPTFRSATSVTSPSGPASEGSRTRVFAPFTCRNPHSTFLHYPENFERTQTEFRASTSDFFPISFSKLTSSRVSFAWVGSVVAGTFVAWDAMIGTRT
jgi:hypothetical protein